MNYEERMNEYYKDFSENDKYIASCILQNDKDCIRLTIHEFAQVLFPGLHRNYI